MKKSELMNWEMVRASQAQKDAADAVEDIIHLLRRKVDDIERHHKRVMNDFGALMAEDVEMAINEVMWIAPNLANARRAMRDLAGIEAVNDFLKISDECDDA